jgi:hypothetical protein
MDVVTQPKSIGVSQFWSRVSIELYWLPLGAGGRFVRLNGRIYEALHALVERRRPLDLYHSALEVRVPEGRFIIENCWPIPDQESAARGVVVEGPVGSRRMARWRVFRYEVRRWRDGTIADADEAVASPQPLSDDLLVARRLLNLVGSLPTPVWGRDELGTGEMWNSNSVISWLLARSGLPTDTITPPAGGRAPGWEAGLITAHRQHCSDEWLGMVRDKDGHCVPTSATGYRLGVSSLSSLPSPIGGIAPVPRPGSRWSIGGCRPRPSMPLPARGPWFACGVPPIVSATART